MSELPLSADVALVTGATRGIGAAIARALAAAGAKFLARGMPAAVKESGEMQRLVVVEFDSLQAALAAYDSAGYKAALKALGDNAVVRDIRIIEGT